MESIYLHRTANGYEARKIAEQYLSLYTEDEQPEAVILYFHMPRTVVLCPSREFADKLRDQMPWLKFDDEGIGPAVQVSCLIFTGSTSEFIDKLGKLYELKETTL